MMAFTWCFAAVALFVSWCEAIPTTDLCYANTTGGEVEGCLGATMSGRQYCAFHGLPYALPPTGNRRFKVGNCTAGLAKYPILFFIHPSLYLFDAGADERFVSPKFLLEKDVILVAPNYRLGALGFATTGECSFSGNWGLKDLVAALSAIYINALAFGGDPNKITVIGDGHGANLAQALLYVPQTAGLIYSLIIGSGNLGNPYAIGPLPLVVDATEKLAKLVNCPTNSSQATLQCLQKVPFKQLVKHQLDVYPNPDAQAIYANLWAPVIEKAGAVGAVLTFAPNVQTCCRLSYNLFRGPTTYDGGFYTQFVLDPSTGLMERFNTDRLTTIINTLQLNTFFCEECLYSIAAEIDQYFFKGQPITRCSELALDDLYGTWYFFLNAELTALRHNGLQYVFQYNNVLSVSFNDVYLGNLTAKPTRTDITLSYLPVEILFPDRQYPATDLEIIRTNVQYIYNFATHLNPTYGMQPQWEAVQPGDVTYRLVSNNGTVQLPNYLPAGVRFFYYLLARYPFKFDPAGDYYSC